MSEYPTVVFGLDGAGFELIEPWIDAGELPNIARAVDTGMSGDLQSVLPPVTSPNWKAYSTGKNPGKIGIYWWENIDTEQERVYYPTERKHLNTEFWEIIGESDSTGVVGVPTTYPPKSINGFLISGAPDGEDTGYASPSDLECYLDEEFDYRVLKRNRLTDDTESAAAEIHELIDLRFSVAKRLIDRYDLEFLQVTSFYLNSLHHYLWEHEYTLQAWKIIDQHLEYFLDGDWNVVLMSDHGSNMIRTVFHINTWLEQQGYLETDTGVADTLHRLGVNTDRLLRIAGAFGAQRLAKRLAPEWLLNYIPNESGGMERTGKEGTVDWEHTDVIASGQGPVYLTLNSASPRYERLRTELIEKLTELSDDHGNPVASEVYRGEEVYEGGYLNDAPDIVIDQSPGVHIPGNIGRQEVFTDPEGDGWRGENKRAGLFVATGPSFGRGHIESLSILDLAPTLLHLHDCSIPKDMDGSVRGDVFASGADPVEREVSYRSGTANYVEKERIRRIARRADF